MFAFKSRTLGIPEWSCANHEPPRNGRSEREKGAGLVEAVRCGDKGLHGAMFLRPFRRQWVPPERTEAQR
eukprot:scaffold1748_cov258-Pinguiococcus_pyrenoidosus.AAC.6